ncbi:MAG: acetyl-CoA synthetase [Deltaproteobacteria bacterium GWC2_42_51]|nr:MAG: acetyl-CoA synthetase [Deltaproteobacteria bacterium GWB2_42_7]OGP34693.1 MAG: acetyl-CoA synthetase [Deltaproteobacteria bacterium GWC2_42_51]OGP42945.1 MAG: acetyl-CoA synthetase [Deltaproteobacteria bacterium GWD2_42_10]OGQ25388.1 MAG: acetyl-CoA synthetase [Deltaproteobacteria bacterium RIFCSPHIGHO2_02_FULL_42_44]OGQ35292.1 MAG: acetyl-CoA synthetase [Deltaproteobacteria bacterium RIFCSPLOWO2_02_FULL_42_39]OGQ64558.1 MAG: acetyl-CoA synthetase [Deltaproteobacteria bacterium RIFCSPL
MIQQEAKKLITDAIASGRKSLLEPEAKEIIKAWGIPVPPFFVAKDRNLAMGAGNNIGYPVVLKVISGDILHKTEAGGVRMGLKNEQEVEEAFNEMIFEISDHMPTARIEGFLIEKMAAKGVEVIVGGIRDAQFGPAVMFGLGGMTVELLKDVSFRLAPVTREECLDMISEIKAHPLLTGYRGAEPSDIDVIVDCIIKVGNIMDAVDEIKEMEVNPLIVYEKGAMAVDARVVLWSEPTVLA